MVIIFEISSNWLLLQFNWNSFKSIHFAVVDSSQGTNALWLIFGELKIFNLNSTHLAYRTITISEILMVIINRSSARWTWNVESEREILETKIQTLNRPLWRTLFDFGINLNLNWETSDSF